MGGFVWRVRSVDVYIRLGKIDSLMWVHALVKQLARSWTHSLFLRHRRSCSLIHYLGKTSRGFSSWRSFNLSNSRNFQAAFQLGVPKSKSFHTASKLRLFWASVDNREGVYQDYAPCYPFLLDQPNQKVSVYKKMHPLESVWWFRHVNVWNLIIESHSATKRVPTGALEALDDPPVVQIWKNFRGSVDNTYNLLFLVALRVSTNCKVKK